MQLCFFDDTRATRLMPLTLTRPSNMLRSGIMTITEKWVHHLSPEHVTRQMPSYMMDVYDAPPPRPGLDCLWINGRFLPDLEVVGEILRLKNDQGLMHANTPVALRLSAKRTATIFKAENIPGTDVFFSDTEMGTLLDAPWQVFTENGEQILADMGQLKSRCQPFDAAAFPGVYASGADQVYLEEGVTIEPGCILNATEGPIFLGRHATVMNGAILRGPLAVCEHATIKAGAKIYGETTIGPWCKIGGEVHNVVFQAYSNKAHDGFLGNSAIGEWCNLGADTNNSNLKNNYGTVKLADWKTGKEYDTGLQFCGTIMGDHSKTAINTMLNTGTVCGVSSNIFSGSFPPRHVRSFRWISPAGEEIYRFEKAIETATRMMSRRGKNVGPAYRNMLRYIFDKAERANL